GDPVEGEDEGRRRAREVLGVVIFVRVDPGDDALVIGAVREPVEVDLLDLVDRDLPVRRDPDDLPGAVVGVDPSGEVDLFDRHPRPERLEHRVAAAHRLELRSVLPFPAALGALPGLGLDLALVGRMVGAVLSFGRGPPPAQAAPTRASAPAGGFALRRAVRAAWPPLPTGHFSPTTELRALSPRS